MGKYHLVLILVFISPLAFSQPRPLYNNLEQRSSQILAQSIEVAERARLEKVYELAQKNNWLLKQHFSDGTTMILSGMSETGQPIYEISYQNRLAALTTRTNTLYEGGGVGLNLTGGSDVMKNRLAVWDAGKILNTHIEFGGRVSQADNATTVDGHATHVTGTMIAAGINPNVKGMAYGANILAYDFSNDNVEMAAAASGLLVSNHSYGTVTGWKYNGDRPGTDTNLKWEWYGDSTINDQQDYKFGFYDTKAREWDRIIYGSPYYLIVKSAGNDHGSNGPPAGTAYFLGSSQRTSKTARANQNGYDQISMYGNAKNIFTVGAISALANGYNVITDPKISSFSSWGPTDDGRIKPDIVGDGVSVLSTTSTNNSAYTSLSGTSMSSPNVSGTIFLLQELYVNLNKVFMKSATLKGLAIHTADDAGNVGPDYIYGWGVLNARKAAEVILNRDQSAMISERVLNPNETYTMQVVASGKGALTATICWTDPEATASTATAANFNNRTPKLVNDLDLTITDGTTDNLPFVLNPDQPASLATRGNNIRDNVEQVLIPNAIPGKTYTVTIKHKGTLTNGKQDYALIMSGIGGKAYCESKATTNADGKILKVVLGNITQNGMDGCQTYNDFTSKIAEISTGQPLPLEITVGSCGQNVDKFVKVFIDWNNNGSFEEANELVASSGKLANNEILKTTINAPSGLVLGSLTRVRIVCVETNNAANVSSCGNYTRGETQEFLMRFTQPARDLALNALLSPQTGFCGNQANIVTVSVKNVGTETISNIPVSVQVKDSTGRVLGTLTGTIAQPISAFNDAKISLTAPFLGQLEAGKTYTFECSITQSDQDMSNNVLVVKRVTAQPTPAPNATATFCDNDPVALISRGTGGTAFWYDSAIGGNFLAGGNVASSTIKTPNNVYYVVQNQFNQKIGPSTKSAFGGGSYSGNFGPAPFFRTEVPMVLESARLYIANAGKLTFTVLGLDDSYVSEVTLDVVPTRNSNAPNVGAPSGQIADDPNDLGAVYQLNLPIPKAGDYKISIGYENGASIFRSNVGVSGFPFKIPNVITYRGALFDNGTKIDTLTTAYYYFFDLKLAALGCPSSRMAVTAQTATKMQPTISTDGKNTICEGKNIQINATPNAGSYQWLFNGQPIVDATKPSYLAASTGNYIVSASLNNCLPTQSASLTLTLLKPEKPVITAKEIELTSSVIDGNQWFLNGMAIAGATNQKLVAPQTGAYTVKANVNGCGDALSDEKLITITALFPLDLVGNIVMKAYPNPVQNTLICEVSNVPNSTKIIEIILADINGRIIARQSVEKTGQIFYSEFNLENIKNGTIIAVFKDKNEVVYGVKKVLKQ